jgi:TRAP transporter TAXI family solute receptor
MKKLLNMLRQDWFWIVIVFGALGVIGILYALVGVRPPKEFTIATGRQGGAYYFYAQEYQRLLAEQGYTLNIRETAGTIETIELLESGDVDVGFVQNTAIGSTPSSPLTTLAALYYEALWIFYRDDIAVDPSRISELSGLRINIGEEGSGGYQAILGLLAMNNISDQNATLSTLSDDEAAQRLKDGELDVMMTFLGATSPLVTDLATTPGIDLAPVRRAATYASRFKNLAALTLPEGVIDFAADVPPEDTPLLATRATLVAGPTLHPDLANLLVILAADIHGHGGIFEAPGEFPAPTAVGIPMNADAERYMASGSTFLERYFPLTLASRLERILLLLVPIALIAYPILRGTLSLSHVYYSDRLKWRYRALRSIDREYKSYDKTQLEEAITLLSAEQDSLASDMTVPTTMLDDLYNLHYHTSLVLDRLQARLAVLEQEP